MQCFQMKEIARRYTQTGDVDQYYRDLLKNIKGGRINFLELFGRIGEKKPSDLVESVVEAVARKFRRRDGRI